MKKENVFETSVGEVEVEPKLIGISEVEAAFIKAFTEFPMLQLMAGNQLMGKFCGRVMGILFIEGA